MSLSFPVKNCRYGWFGTKWWLLDSNRWGWMKKQLIGVQILTLRRHHNETEQEEHQYPDQEIYWETISRNMSIEGRIRGSLQERMQRGFFSLSIFTKTHPKKHHLTKLWYQQCSWYKIAKYWWDIKGSKFQIT